jgi:hypothetical protein
MKKVITLIIYCCLLINCNQNTKNNSDTINSMLIYNTLDVTEYDIDYYVLTDNPLDNFDSFFNQAIRILGENTYLLSLRGIQHDSIPDKDYNLNWYWFFYNDFKMKKLVFDISKNKIFVSNFNEFIPGIEYIYKDNIQIDNVLFTPKDIFNKCILENNVNILNIEIYIPLIYPRSEINYYYYSKEGYGLINVDFFIYSSKTGNKL